MGRILFLLLLVIIFNCTLTEPCCLIIENDSEYTINVSISNGNKSEITLDKNKGDNVLVSPGEIELKISIKSIRFSKKYSITMNYLEKKKFIFKIDK